MAIISGRNTITAGSTFGQQLAEDQPPVASRPARRPPPRTRAAAATAPRRGPAARRRARRRAPMMMIGSQSARRVDVERPDRDALQRAAPSTARSRAGRRGTPRRGRAAARSGRVDPAAGEARDEPEQRRDAAGQQRGADADEQRGAAAVEQPRQRRRGPGCRRRGSSAASSVGPIGVEPRPGRVRLRSPAPARRRPSSCPARLERNGSVVGDVLGVQRRRERRRARSPRAPPATPSPTRLRRSRRRRAPTGRGGPPASRAPATPARDVDGAHPRGYFTQAWSIMKLPVTDGLNWKLPTRSDTKSSGC